MKSNKKENNNTAIFICHVVQEVASVWGHCVQDHRSHVFSCTSGRQVFAWKSELMNSLEYVTNQEDIRCLRFKLTLEKPGTCVAQER